MNTAEVREAAAQLIERQDWYSAWLNGPKPFEPTEAVCVVESIALTGADGRITQATLKELRQELGVESLASWQDQPGRTKEEVLAALRGKP